MPHSKEMHVLCTPQSKHASLVFLYLMAGITLLIAVFLFVPTAHAQVEDVQVIPQEVVQDDAVQLDDLGVEESGVLPDSRLHFFKRISRRIQEAVTFNTVKKAELQLQHANEELLEAQQLLEHKPTNPRAIEAVGKATERFEQKIARIEEKTEKLKEKKDAGDDRADALLSRILDAQIKQQKVLGKMEEKMDPRQGEQMVEALRKVHEAQEESAAHVGRVLGIEGPEALANRISRVLSAQDGSAFKELRNLEIIKRIDDHADGAFAEAFATARDASFARFEQDVRVLGEEEKKERFLAYVSHMAGDETRQIEIIDALQQSIGETAGVSVDVESAKDLLAQRFAAKLDGLNEDISDVVVRAEFRARALERFDTVQDDVGRLRALEDLRMRAAFDDPDSARELERQHTESLRSFVDAFPDAVSQDQARRYEELRSALSERPDPTTFRLIQQLEQEVRSQPEKQALLKQLDRAAKVSFAEQAQEDPESFFESIASSNPEDVALLKSLQQEFAAHPEDFMSPASPRGVGPDGDGPPPFQGDQFLPPGLDPLLFERALDIQARKLKERLGAIQSPEEFEHFQNKFDDIPPAVLEEIGKRDGAFDDVFREKREEELQKRVERDAVRIQQELSGARQAGLGRIDENIHNAQSDEERLRLEEERITFLKRVKDKELELRRKTFEEQATGTPFCDDECRAEERARFEIRLGNERSQSEEILQFEQFNKQEFRAEFRENVKNGETDVPHETRVPAQPLKETVSEPVQNREPKNEELRDRPVAPVPGENRARLESRDMRPNPNDEARTETRVKMREEGPNGQPRETEVRIERKDDILRVRSDVRDGGARIREDVSVRQEKPRDEMRPPEPRHESEQRDEPKE